MKNEHWTFEQTLRHDNPIVRDHHVHDVRTLPGVTLLDMVYRLAPECVGSRRPFELRRVVFKQPIVTSEGLDRRISVSFTPQERGWRVTVRSGKLKGDRLLEGPLADNMECTLAFVDDEAPSPGFDVAAFIRSAERELDMDAVYGVSKRADIRHLSFMRTLGIVYTRGFEELMRLRLGDEAERARPRFLAHPALLDGSTFAGQSMRVHDTAFGDDNTPYIPFTIERFRLYQPLPREVFTYSDNEALWRHARGPLPDLCSTDIVLFNAAGERLARFDKMSMKRIRSSGLIRDLVQAAASGLPTAAPEPARPAVPPPQAPQPAPAVAGSARDYIVARVAEALQRPAEAVDTTENFYDLGMDSSQLLQLTQQLEAVLGQELYPTLLFEHSSIDKLADYLEREFAPGALAAAPVHAAPATAKPAAAEAVAAGDEALLLLEPVECATEAQADAKAVPSHVVWVAGLDASPRGTALRAALERLPEVQEVVTLLPTGADAAQYAEDLLLQLVGHLKNLVSRHTSGELVLQVLVSEALGHGWSAAVCDGCLKTLALEYPRIRCQVLLLEELPALAPASIAAVLQQEARAARRGAVRVSYGDGLTRRRQAAWREVALPARHPDAFQARGTYVIAGGMGGLGLLLARYLLEKYQAKLALVGRSALSPAMQLQLEALARCGGEVSYHAADLADQPALARALEQVRRRHGPIDGVVHSAGRVHDQVVSRKDLQEAQRVIEPKITGLWHLDQATKDDPLSFFAIFSSLSAVTGNIGQIDYSGANAFEDEFARYRQQLAASGERHGRTVSINWPLWADGGMSIAGGAERKLYESTGLRPLPTAPALAALEWMLGQDRPRVAVAYGRPQAIRGHLQAQGLLAPTGEPLQPAPAPAARTGQAAAVPSGAIAIIGLAGRYPQAGSVEQFGRNLREGRNCISGLPLERWQGYDFGYEIERYYRYGGFLDQIDQFDPMFFGIPPVRANALDPQARLFLETAWEACEDAGFAVDRRTQHYPAGGQRSVGVFAGAFWSHYELFSADRTAHGLPTSLGVSLSSISNMTSYCLNFHGPSVAVDTMCSSALTAVHLACESLHRGECQFAIAGGVNLVAHPHKFIFLKENNFLASDGNCRSYGEGGDGYVPGEGVGAVLLTPLERALEMGFPIRAVILGSAINHSGKTAGGTVPNPVAQTEVIADALTAARVDPRTIGYVEGHGTGTALGDPIEVEGLTRAFERWTQDKQFCALGSSKSNIGHLEAAAGIAGLTKLVLQFEAGEMFPSLHADPLNPHIPFATTPFVVQTGLRTWERPRLPAAGTTPRRALISSFGASGSNASLVLEEYVAPASAQPRSERVLPQCIVLSARDPAGLAATAGRLLEAVRRRAWLESELPALAYTLQSGREAMAERTALVAHSLAELESMLAGIASGSAGQAAVHRGRANRNTGPIPEACYAQWAEAGSREAAGAELLQAWVTGAEVDWARLYPGRPPAYVRLPGYPFARQRCWVPKAPATEVAVPANRPATAPLPAPVSTPAPTLPPAAKLPPKAAAEPVPAAPASASGARVRLGSPAAAVQAASRARPAAKARVQLAMPHAMPHAPIAAGPAPAAAPSDAQLESSLAESLAKVLFVTTDEINPEAPFPDLGLDSVIAVQWVKAINQEFGIELKATVLYEYPTVRRLAGLVAAERLGPAPAAAAEAVPAPAAPAPVSAAPAPAPALAADVDQVRQFLVHSLAAVLFLEEESVDLDASFIDLGLDSIIAVQWMKAINAEYQADFKATILYQHSTLNALAAYVAAPPAMADETPLPAAPEPAAATESAAEPEPAAAATTPAAPLPAPAEIAAFLKQSLAAVLFIEPAQVEDTVIFTDYGLDSIIAVQWIKAVNAQFGTAIKATALYQHPTIAALTQQVAAELAGGAAPEGGAEPAPAAPQGGESGDTAGLVPTVVDLGAGRCLEVLTSGQGTPVLLLLPMGTRPAAWTHQIRELLPTHRVLLVQHPGHGRSVFPVGDIGFDALAEGVLLALERLAGPTPVHVVGWSMGALLAQRIALQAQHLQSPRVRSLTLVNAPAHGLAGDTAEVAMAILASMSQDFADNLPPALQGTPESRYDAIKATVKLDVSLAWLEATLAFDYPGARRLAVPTLVVVGARDQVIRREHGPQLAAMIPGARIAEHAAGGHYVPLHHPGWFNAELRRFLATTEAGATADSPPATPGDTAFSTTNSKELSV